jgi:peptidoglycan/xylan/chitin deacetylase (PgdA/CDA1 family)
VKTIEIPSQTSSQISLAPANTLAILMYHSVDTSGSVISVAPQDFANQMRCLSRLGFRGITLREAVAHYGARGSWPEGCVVLTFDDGYENFYLSAYPELNKYGFAATVFVVSQHMGGVNDWAPPPPGLGTRAMLSWQQAIDLCSKGVEIGAHTRTHTDLRRLSREAARDEILSSRLEIEKHLRRPVESFAYPFGWYNRESLEIVKGGFQSACTTSLRQARVDALHKLPRVDMYYIRSERRLRRLVGGSLDSYLCLRRWGRAVRQVFRASV